MNMQRSIVLSLAFGFLFSAVFPTPLAVQPKQGTESKEITVSFIARNAVSHRCTISEKTLQGLQSILIGAETRLRYTQSYDQALSLVTQVVQELDDLHLLPSSLHPLEVIREIAASRSINIPRSLQTDGFSGPYINSGCLLYLSTFDAVDLTPLSVLGSLLAHFRDAPWRITALGLLLEQFATWNPVRCMDIIWIPPYSSDTYITLGINGIKAGNNNYGDDYVTSVIGFTGLKIILPFEGSVYNQEEYYLGFAVLVM